MGILLTFLGVFLTFTLFIVSIVPVFVGLAEDSKTYVLHTVTAIEQQARAGFPVIDSLPLNLGTLIRSEVDIAHIASFVTDQNRAQFVVDGLVGNIDTIKDFIQK